MCYRSVQYIVVLELVLYMKKLQELLKFDYI